jgi:release factor glutamine methyltransferase
MQLIRIRALFSDSLKPLYPEQEIYSLFERTIQHFLDFSKIQIHQNLDKNIAESAEKKILDVLRRLKTAEPLQYILGKTSFLDYSIHVDPRVLIPRPETEYLVDLLLKDTQDNTPNQVMDLCTGSGCVAIALAGNLSKSKVFAVDLSDEVLAVARRNAIENQVPITFIQDDLLNPQAEYPCFDLIISNPPYVRNFEKQFMHQNVLDYEPSPALFVEDEKPLIFYHAIEQFSRKYLNSGGKLYMEINENLGAETAAIFQSAHYQQVEILSDLENKNRYIRARK